MNSTQHQLIINIDIHFPVEMKCFREGWSLEFLLLGPKQVIQLASFGFIWLMHLQQV